MDKQLRQNIRLLIVGSIFFALAAAISVLAVNSYWVGATVDPTLQPGLPTDLWDGVAAALIVGIIGEAVFFGLFFYPAARLGRAGILAYLIVNGLAAAFGAMVYSSQQDPSALAGWGYLTLILLILAPVALTFIFLGIGAYRLGRRAKSAIESQRSQPTPPLR